MARQLRQSGESVGLLALLDSAPANAGYERVAWWRPDFVPRFVRNLKYWLADFSALPVQERRRFARRKARVLGRKLLRRVLLDGKAQKVDLEEVIDPSQIPQQELQLWQIHLEALSHHVEQPYDGHVHLFRTRGQPLFCSLEEDFCWGKLARGGVSVVPIPGSHENIFTGDNVRGLARALEACLERSCSKHPHPDLNLSLNSNPNLNPVDVREAA
jgi:thioesterase domain-containing protein